MYTLIEKYVVTQLLMDKVLQHDPNLVKPINAKQLLNNFYKVSDFSTQLEETFPELEVLLTEDFTVQGMIGSKYCYDALADLLISQQIEICYSVDVSIALCEALQYTILYVPFAKTLEDIFQYVCKRLSKELLGRYESIDLVIEKISALVLWLIPGIDRTYCTEKEMVSTLCRSHKQIGGDTYHEGLPYYLAQKAKILTEKERL